MINRIRMFFKMVEVGEQFTEGDTVGQGFQWKEQEFIEHDCSCKKSTIVADKIKTERTQCGKKLGIDEITKRLDFYDISGHHAKYQWKQLGKWSARWFRWRYKTAAWLIFNWMWLKWIAVGCWGIVVIVLGNIVSALIMGRMI